MGDIWTCVWVITQGIWMGIFSFRDISWCESNTASLKSLFSCHMSLSTLSTVTQHLIIFSFCLYICLLWICGSFLCVYIAFSLPLSLSVFSLALYHCPVSWLDNANTLFITLHSFSGLYWMPSNQAIVSYGARDLIMRHRTSVKAVSHEMWHAL